MAQLKREWDQKSIADTRRKLGLSQAGFARLMGISVRTLQDWEQGRSTPTGPAQVLLRVAARHPKSVQQIGSTLTMTGHRTRTGHGKTGR
jgi:putative transcriptional regulator